MDLVKQQQNTAESGNKGKNQQDRNNKQRFSITNFEDMSNELLHEIFEFIDAYHAYEVFSNLNTRFQSLLVYSSLPLRINLPFTCKSIFQHRCKHFVMPNIHRIMSLRISHYLTNHLFFTLFIIDSSFVRLESLILNNLQIDKVVDILTRLALLPRLASLSISVSDYDEPIQDVGDFYRLIFRLPVLKYGKFLFQMRGTSPYISISDNKEQQYSPVEYLIIDGYCCIHQFNAILSYTPWLRHFSCDQLSSFETIQIEISNAPSYLTHLTIGNCILSFDDFQLFIVKICSQLKVLRISYRADIDYLDASRWERLISHHMYHLSIFDFQHLTIMKNKEEYHTIIDRFVSPFWIQRQWFFAHQHCSQSGRVKFYSTQPYRRDHYDIFERTDDDTCSCQENGLSLARNINIEGHHLIPDCSIQFARATKLILRNLFAENNNQFITNLTHCIPLTQINKLYIRYYNLNADMLIEILCHMPNLVSLRLYYRLLQHVTTRSSREETQIAHLMSTNKITKVIINDPVKNTLEDLRFFIDLCSRIEYLEIGIREDSLEYIAQLISSTHINNSSHLFSLLIWDVNHAMFEKLQTIIGYDKLLHNDYTFKHIDNFLHVWW